MFPFFSVIELLLIICHYQKGNSSDSQEGRRYEGRATFVVFTVKNTIWSMNAAMAVGRGTEKTFQDMGSTRAKAPGQGGVCHAPRTARRLMWLHWGGRVSGDKVYIVLVWESKRNVCKHALQSTKPWTAVRINTGLSVSGALPSAPEAAGWKGKTWTHFLLFPPSLNWLFLSSLPSATV